MRICWGIGSALLDSGQLVPLVLLNAGLFGVPKDMDTALHPFRLDDAPNLPQSWLPPAFMKLPVYGLIVAKPRPCASAGSAEEVVGERLPILDPIMCDTTGKIGTAGTLVWDEMDRAFAVLTAGHVFPHGCGSSVSRRQDRFISWPRTYPLGRVSHHIVPAGTAGWDAAVILPHHPLSSTAHRKIGPLLTRLDRIRSVVAYGAFTGFVDEAALLSGAIVEGGSEEIEWKNCWMLAPSNVLTSGDSGAPVFARDNSEFLGTYVGVSQFMGTRKAIVHYVQDAASLQREVLASWGVSFR